MAGKESSPESIKVDVYPTVTQAPAGDALIKGVELIIQDQIPNTPPTSIKVFPESYVQVTNPDFDLRVRGSASLQLTEQGPVITSCGDGRKSTLRVTPNGGILFMYNPHPDRQVDVLGSIVPQIGSPTGRSPSRPRQTLDAEPFSGVTTENPSSFDPLTFGQILRFFRQEAGLKQSELAEKAGGISSTITISRLETGSRPPTARGLLGGITNNLVKGFGWQDNDPRILILQRKYRAEAEEASKRPRRRTI